MSAMKIVCNNQYRPLLRWHDLTREEQKEFDYLETEDAQCNAEFVRYKGWVYDIGEFQYICGDIAPPPQRPGWETFDGHHDETAFSGVLIRLSKDYESALVASYFC